MRNTPRRLISNCAVACIALFSGIANAQEPATFKFAWPVPSRAWITETTLKKGKTTKLKYQIVISPDEGTKNLALRFQNFSILELAGLDLKSPSNQKEVQQALALASAIPTVIITSEGAFSDLRGFDEMMTRVLASLPDKEARTRAEQMLKSPEMVQVIKQKGAEFWTVWVSFWLDLEALPEGTTKTTQEVPMPDGSVLTAPVILVNKGSDKNNPANVTLEMESVMEGEGPTKSMGRYLEMLSKRNSPKDGKVFRAEMMEKATRATRLRLITEPKTMRPAFASSEAVTTVKVKGEGEQREIERREYQFAWK